MSNYSIHLSTTEPNNYVGLLKFRQGDAESQVLNVSLTENGLPFNFDELTVYLNAVLPNGNVIRDKVTDIDYIHSTLTYVISDSFLQEIARVTAWFSFEKEERIIDSTKNFNYIVVGGWKECISQGNYIYELSEIQREIEEIIGNKDFTSFIKRTDELETAVNFLSQSKADKSYVDSQVSSIISGTPAETFKTLDELKAKYPKGNTGVMLVLADGHWYYWDSKVSLWQDGGVYQSMKLSEENLGDASFYIFNESNLIMNGNFGSGSTNYANLFSPSSVKSIVKDYLGRNWLHIHNTDTADEFAGVNFIINDVDYASIKDNLDNFDIEVKLLFKSNISQKLSFVLRYFDENNKALFNETLMEGDFDFNDLRELNFTKKIRSIENAFNFKFAILGEKNKLVNFNLADLIVKPVFKNDLNLIKNGSNFSKGVGNAQGENGATLTQKNVNNKTWMMAEWSESIYPRIAYELPIEVLNERKNGYLQYAFDITSKLDIDTLAVRLTTYGETSSSSQYRLRKIKANQVNHYAVSLPYTMTESVTRARLFVFDISEQANSGNFGIKNQTLSLIDGKNINNAYEFPNMESAIAFGDSITRGYKSTNELVNSYTNTLQGMSGVIIDNRAISGGNWQYGGTSPDVNSVLNRIRTTDLSTADTFLLAGGTNDFAQGLPIGDLSDQRDDTLMGAMNQGIQFIYDVNPDAKIYLITPMWRSRITGDPNVFVDVETTPNKSGLFLRDYVKAVTDIAAKYHIPVLDLYHNFQINEFNFRNWLVDGLHPNDKGYVELAKVIGKFISAN